MDMRYVLFLILIPIGIASSTQILGIFTLGCKSTHMYYQTLVKILLDAGYNVTVIDQFPQTHKIANYTNIDVSEDGLIKFDGSLKINEIAEGSLSNLYLGYNSHLINLQKLYTSKKIRTLLNSGQKFDLVITELDGAECFLPLAFTLGTSVVGIYTTIVPFPNVDWMIGNPINPSWLPASLSGFSTSMNFTERVKNFLDYIFYFIFGMVYTSYSDALTAKYIPESPPTRQLFDKISLIFTNSNPNLISRPLLPRNVEIGGIHINKANALPKNIKNFIDESTNGTIFVSFGSTIKFSSLPKEHHDAFVKVFSTLPYRILWKHDEPELVQNISKNIMAKRWFPQADILAEDKIILFISHCGALSLYESISRGKPLLAIPIYYDQPMNAAIVHDLKIGLKLNYKNINEQLLRNSIEKITRDVKFGENMSALSKQFKDRPTLAARTFLYWIQFVLRHRRADHLHHAGKNLSFFQYCLLDVISFLFTILVILLSLTYFLIKMILKKLRKNPVKRKKN